jgi:hypothetical protein
MAWRNCHYKKLNLALKFLLNLLTVLIVANIQCSSDDCKFSSKPKLMQSFHIIFILEDKEVNGTIHLNYVTETYYESNIDLKQTWQCHSHCFLVSLPLYITTTPKSLILCFNLTNPLLNHFCLTLLPHMNGS